MFRSVRRDSRLTNSAAGATRTRPQPARCDDYFLVLEYVDGQSLAGMIDAAAGPLPEKRALQLIREVLAALNCAHEHGILHRDVEPPNVLVDQDGRARLTDFGIARELGQTGRSEAGMTVGTVEYMSPEQIRDPDSVDQRSDVYSAGILLFEMLTGKVPFDGPTPAHIRSAQLDTPPPDPRARHPAIKNKLAGIVGKAMRKDPQDRFQGCLEFEQVVAAYAHPPMRLWAVWALALAVAGGAGYYFFVARPDTQQAIQEHLRVATGNYALLCQQAQTLQMKRDGQRLAAENGDPVLARAFARQIGDVRANMDKFAAAYGGQVSAIAAYDPDTVQRALAAQPAGPPSGRDRYRALALADVGKLASGTATPDALAMTRNCPYRPD